MNRQKGMTMVELVVAIAITGIIVAFLGTAIYQIITVTGYGNDRLTAVHELQNAAYWFNLDGQEAIDRQRRQRTVADALRQLDCHLLSGRHRAAPHRRRHPDDTGAQYHQPQLFRQQPRHHHVPDIIPGRDGTT